MNMIDFEYDGIKLSSLKMSISSFSDPDDEQELGNNLELVNVKGQFADSYFSAGYSYTEPYQLEFYTTKYNCDNYDDFVISDAELNTLIRWLNRKSYCKFKPIYNDGSFADVYYMAYFNMSLLKAGGDIVGLRLTLNCNAPFGYQETKVFNGTLGSSPLTIEDVSDEIGHLYCKTTITVKSAGDLTIQNSADKYNAVIIKNCKENEIITMSGDTKIITTSMDSHKKLPNDFNFNYIRLVNTFSSRTNIFTANLPCEIKMEYNPIRKVGLLI